MRRRLGIIAAVALLVAACDDNDKHQADGGEHDGARHDVLAGDGSGSNDGTADLGPDLGPVTAAAVDILFVVDNSDTMLEEQKALTTGLGTLFDALKLPKFQGRLPNLHIGVVSTNMGAGTYDVPSCETVGGDGGKLLSKARVAGCTPPSNPWISYDNGTTNISKGATSPIERLKEGFSCIASLGGGGCAFEQPLQAARQALDGCGPPNYSCTTNPGFARKDGTLAVVIITDEDDCSASNAGLFDPQSTSLGPLQSYRCTQFGLTCDQSLATTGTKTNCAPGQTWLVDTAGYVSFFKSLRPTGRVILAAIAGPTVPVTVEQSSQKLVLAPSCTTAMGKAVPAIRIRTVLTGLGADGLFNQGISTTGQSTPVDICSGDFTNALRLLGQKIVATL